MEDGLYQESGSVGFQTDIHIENKMKYATVFSSNTQDVVSGIIPILIYDNFLYIFYAPTLHTYYLILQMSNFFTSIDKKINNDLTISKNFSCRSLTTYDCVSLRTSSS